MEIIEMGNSTAYVDPSWNGSGFHEYLPNLAWEKMPPSLKGIAHSELATGNRIRSVIENHERTIVIVCFEREPASSPQSDNSIVIHTQHEYGNYCYDGTATTYEDTKSGCFLTFDIGNDEICEKQIG